jgi:hypothetical protein
MIRTMDDSSDLWRMRKQFTLQLASLSFMTYVLCLSSRSPSRFHMSRATGLIAMTELLPGEDSLRLRDWMSLRVIMIRCLKSTTHLRHKRCGSIPLHPKHAKLRGPHLYGRHISVWYHGYRSLSHRTRGQFLSRSIDVD